MLLCEQRMAFDLPVWGDGKTTDIASLDPAYKGIGGDRCVLRHLRFGKDPMGRQILSGVGNPIMVPLDGSSRATSEEQIAYYVRDFCVGKNIPPENFALDATMAGTLVSAIGQIWSPSFVAITCGGKPQDRPIRSGDTKLESEAYGKMVSALWFASYYTVEGGQLRGVTREEVEEASMREWKLNNNQSARRQDPVIDVEPKEDMKKRMGRSPDLWDSFVIGLELARRRGFVIGGGPALPINTRKAPEWALRKRDSMKTLAQRHTLVYA